MYEMHILSEKNFGFTIFFPVKNTFLKKSHFKCSHQQ